jgi:hypothetical protein
VGRIHEQQIQNDVFPGKNKKKTIRISEALKNDVPDTQRPGLTKVNKNPIPVMTLFQDLSDLVAF